MESDITEWISKDCTQSFENHTSDAWNHLIYGEIIKLTGEIPYDIINKKNNPAVIYNKKIQGSLFKQTIRRLLDFYRNFYQTNSTKLFSYRAILIILSI